MVGIDVLDVPGAIDADAGGQVDCMMLDTELASSGSERSAAIGAQNQVGRHEGLQLLSSWPKLDAYQPAIFGFSPGNLVTSSCSFKVWHFASVPEISFQGQELGLGVAWLFVQVLKLRNQII